MPDHRLETIGPTFPTDEELAAMQDAVASAHDRWAAELEDEVPYEPPTHTGPTDAPEHHPLLAADGEYLDGLWGEVAAGLRGATGG